MCEYTIGGGYDPAEFAEDGPVGYCGKCDRTLYDGDDYKKDDFGNFYCEDCNSQECVACHAKFKLSELVEDQDDELCWFCDQFMKTHYNSVIYEENGIWIFEFWNELKGANSKILYPDGIFCKSCKKQLTKEFYKKGCSFDFFCKECFLKGKHKPKTDFIIADDFVGYGAE